MNPVKIAESILYDYPCRTEDETSLASAFTGVIISPTEESGVLLLYKGLKKFGNHTESSNESSSGLKTVCLPDQYKPDCEVTKTTIGISIRKCSPTKSGSTTIWRGKELEYVQVQEDLEGWELRILENTFSPSTKLKSGFRYTLETNSHELTVYGHGEDSRAKINAQKHEKNKMNYLFKHIYKQGTSNKNKIDFKNDEDLILLFTFVSLKENSKVNEYFQLCINTLIDLDSNRPNSAIGPTARVKCTDMHSLQELPQLLGADLEVMRDIIKLSLKVKFGKELIENDELKRKVLAHFNKELNYCKSMSIVYPKSDLNEFEDLLGRGDVSFDDIQRTAAVVEEAYVNYFPSENMTLQNISDEGFELCLQRVRVAIDKMWSGEIFIIDETDGQNYKDSYEKKLRDLINQLVQILVAVRIKSDLIPDSISKFIEDLFRDQRYAVIAPKQKHLYPLYKGLQKLCWVMGELETRKTTTTKTKQSPVTWDGCEPEIEELRVQKPVDEITTTTTESETKLDKLFQQYKDGNMGGNWFGNLISLVEQLLDQWKQFVEKKGDHSKVDCKILKEKLNLKDDGTAEKIVERWFKEGEGPLSIMKVERLTTNASVRYYCWSGTLDKEDPFHTHNDTHIPLTMYGTRVELKEVKLKNVVFHLVLLCIMNHTLNLCT